MGLSLQMNALQETMARATMVQAIVAQEKEQKKVSSNVAESIQLAFLIMIKMEDEIAALIKFFSQMTKNAAEMAILYQSEENVKKFNIKYFSAII